jgi:hypothetical protein
MDAGYAVGVAVGATALVAFLARGLQFLVRIERQFGPDEDGKSLRDRMRAVEKALNNGLRSEVRQALTEAAQARKLAGDAARAASVAEQKASEGRHDLQRAINAVRAEIDVLTNVVLTDQAGIWSVLEEAGYERRGSDRPPTG